MKSAGMGNEWLRLRGSLPADAPGSRSAVRQFSWSFDGNSIAAPTDTNTICIWDTTNCAVKDVLDVNGPVYCTAWSLDGSLIAIGTGRDAILLYDIATQRTVRSLKCAGSGWISQLSWNPLLRDLLASASEDGLIRVWDTHDPEPHLSWRGHTAHAKDFSWSPQGHELASCGHDGSVVLWNDKGEQQKRWSMGRSSFLFSLSWTEAGDAIAVGAADGFIYIIDLSEEYSVRALEGHTSDIMSVTFSPDGRLLASRSIDGMLRVWRTDAWTTVSTLFGSRSNFANHSNIGFSPLGSNIAMFDDGNRTLAIWEVDPEGLLTQAAETTVDIRSAKVILVGELNVGKSCVALRLTEDRYEEQPTTHGLRFWSVKPEQWAPQAGNSGERRELIVWDMGGQPEYQLVHQIFLSDTTVAVVLFDPSRGHASLNDVRTWNKRVEKHLDKHTTCKILVGTKRDLERPNYLDPEIHKLVEECGFSGFYYVSAKTGAGIEQLKSALANAVDWSKMLTTSRPELFQLIRDRIEAVRQAGRVVLLMADLERALRSHRKDEAPREAIEIVARQLAQQGIVALSRVSAGDQAIVVRVAAVEMYAGSVILAARGNPLGVPAVEQAALLAQPAFPGLRQSDRLSLADEAVVLDCVVHLLIQHGICLSHEGLLVFPSLFVSEEDTGEDSRTSVSLYYDVSGAIDSIYSSLIASLAMSQGFGRVRLWENRAEFTNNGRGACGLRRVQRSGGFARLDVFFENKTQEATREVFTKFVEQHLKRHGVTISEHLLLSCTSCGYAFPEQIIRTRIGESYSDIGCPNCDCRTKIAHALTDEAVRSASGVYKDVFALRTNADERTKDAAAKARRRLQLSTQRRADAVTILHISDLHLTAQSIPESIIQPLITDLQDPETGLGLTQIDYLVASGDLTNAGKAAEYEVAYALLASLIEKLNLSASRCILVPGNHDIDWDEPTYIWLQHRHVNFTQLEEGSWVEQGAGFLIREDKSYPNRFRNFAELLYHPLLQRPYPLGSREQFLVLLDEETGVQFIAVNSCWKIDEYHPDRSEVDEVALARGLRVADSQVEAAGHDHVAPGGSQITRIVVLHHPISGEDQIGDIGFVEILQKAHVRLCLHGHVHENRADLIGYLHRPTSLHVIGAGSFGAIAKARPKSTPELYNVLELSDRGKKLRVHTRGLQRTGGAWGPWAVWPGKSPNEQLSYYDVVLRK